MSLTRCPKCGGETDLSKEACSSCGIVFSKFYKSRLKRSSEHPVNIKKSGRLRLLVNIFMGIFGIAMFLSGFVILFVTCSGNGAKGTLGQNSCVVLGTGAFVIGIICVLFAAYGIAREVKKE